MDLKDLKIDPEFEEKIPPLTDEEFTQLEANILAEGTLISPLIVWNGVIIDGHNRYRILLEHPEISFTVREKNFANRFEAIAWICGNQLGRRNLSEIQKKYILNQQYEAVKATHGSSDGFRGNQYSEGFLVSGQNDHLPNGVKTRELVARENGVTDSYMKRAQALSRGIAAAEEVSPGIKQELLSGAIRVPEKDVAAIARASPEDRKEMVEELRKPRPSPRKRAELKAAVAEDADKDESEYGADSYTEGISSPTALIISERMASSPEREKREASVHAIIVELTDALESMMFRWDFQFSENSTNLVHADCQQKIRELASRGIEYLKSHQGGNKDAGSET